MDQMHWEQYIMGGAKRKSQNIDGKEVTPEDYYECLDDLAKSAGFETKHDPDSKEYREELVKWLGKNCKPHPNEDSIAIGPDNYDNKTIVLDPATGKVKSGEEPKDEIPDIVLGRDEMRTAGTAKKVHGYNGGSLIKCLEKKSGAK